MRFGRQGSLFYMQWRRPAREDFGAVGLAARFIVNVAALWVAQFLVRGFSIDGSAALIFGAIIFGTINAIIKPIVSILSCALTCATLGLFTLVINTLMLALTAWIAGIFGLAFHVHGVIAAFLGAIIIAVVSTLLSGWLDRNVLAHSRPESVF